MSTHMPGFQSFFRFLRHFVLAKLATSSIRVKNMKCYLQAKEIHIIFLLSVNLSQLVKYPLKSWHGHDYSSLHI